VSLKKAERAGTIIIDTGGRRLYYVLPGNRAYEYPISVGREGFAWTGTENISRVAVWPDWNPPAEMRERQPGLPKTMTGGINNPLGAKALYLGNTLYRIHGTNDPRSIGRASSSGCFRMMNEHVTHLATMAGVGTQVRVVSHY
jgi:lipoprotein-anchoring transpeptidase ErfK/SrfK